MRHGSGLGGKSPLRIHSQQLLLVWFVVLIHTMCFEKAQAENLRTIQIDVAQTVKRLPTMRETRVRSLGWEDPLEKEMAARSNTLQNGLLIMRVNPLIDSAHALLICVRLC